MQPNDLKRGAVIEIDGAPCVVESFIVQSPSSRGANTIWKVRARNLKTKQKVDRAFRSGETIVEPNFERRMVQFLYRDAAGFHFMDVATYDQFELDEEELGEDAGYLVDNLEGVRSLVLDDKVIGIELPLAVEMEIRECDPAVKGNSATARTKSATLQTGLEIQVPEHLKIGDVVRIDTVTGKFVGRVNR